MIGRDFKRHFFVIPGARMTRIVWSQSGAVPTNYVFPAAVGATAT